MATALGESATGQLDPLCVEQIAKRDPERLGKRHENTRARDVFSTLILSYGLGGDFAVHGDGQIAQGKAGLPPSEFKSVSDHEGSGLQFNNSHI